MLGWIGSAAENGGWFPHVHFQLSRLQPVIADMPGAVAEAHREMAVHIYPDPQYVLGRLGYNSFGDPRSGTFVPGLN